MIECSLVVDTVNDKKGKERQFTVNLKGAKTVTHETAGMYEIDDVVELTLTVKCGMIETLRRLRISEPEFVKIMTLVDRDSVLTSFVDPVPVVAERTGTLAKYEGIVPEEVLKKVEAVVPDELLQSLE